MPPYAMPPRFALRLLGAALLSLVGACTTFSAARPADVVLGPSYHWKVGFAAPRDPAVSWFGSFSDCALCEATPLAQSEVGYSYGWRSAARRKYAAGVFVDGPAPQADVYAQLRESGDVNHGVGARAGLAFGRFWTAKVYMLHDRGAGPRRRLLASPGLYYLGRIGDPDGQHGESQAWLVALTQAVGVEFDDGSVTYTPQVALVGAHGELGGDAAAASGRRRLRFDDVFLTATLGVTFRRGPDGGP